MKSAAHCHKLIGETALAMTLSLYEEMMRRDEWYASWKKSHPGLGERGLANAFVKKNVGKMVEGARATLAEMLAGNAPETAKDQIAEALILDKSLQRGRLSGQQMIAR